MENYKIHDIVQKINLKNEAAEAANSTVFNKLIANQNVALFNLYKTLSKPQTAKGLTFNEINNNFKKIKKFKPLTSDANFKPFRLYKWIKNDFESINEITESINEITSGGNLILKFSTEISRKEIPDIEFPGKESIRSNYFGLNPVTVMYYPVMIEFKIQIRKENGEDYTDCFLNLRSINKY